MEELAKAQGNKEFILEHVTGPNYRRYVPDKNVHEKCFGVGSQIFM